MLGRNPEKQHQARLLGGLMAGVVAGLVATWVLDRYQEGAIAATRRAESSVNAEPHLSRQQEDQLLSQQRTHVQAAERIARSATGKGIRRARRRNAALSVHYAAGALAGGAYGFAAEILPSVRRWYGMAYAKFIFLGGSEALMPWLGLGSKRPAQITPAGLPAPLIFGATLETTRRLLRWFL